MIVLALFLAAAPPPAPATSTTAAPGIDEVASVVARVMGATWVAATIDSGHRVDIRSAAHLAWPRVDDDLDVDAATAVARRSYLSAVDVLGLAVDDASARVVATCKHGDAGASVVVAGKDVSIVDVDFVAGPLGAGRLLPSGPFVVRTETRALDVVTGAVGCIAVTHKDGRVGVPDEFTVNLPRREPPTQLQPACTSTLALLTTSVDFVALLRRPSRDTLFALPTPFTRPDLVGFGPNKTKFVIDDMRFLGWWSKAAPTQPLRFALVAEEQLHGVNTQAAVTFFDDFDDVSVSLQFPKPQHCALNGVPIPVTVDTASKTKRNAEAEARKAFADVKYSEHVVLYAADGAGWRVVDEKKQAER